MEARGAGSRTCFDQPGTLNEWTVGICSLRRPKISLQLTTPGQTKVGRIGGIRFPETSRVGCKSDVFHPISGRGQVAFTPPHSIIPARTACGNSGLPASSLWISKLSVVDAAITANCRSFVDRISLNPVFHVTLRLAQLLCVVRRVELRETSGYP